MGAEVLGLLTFPILAGVLFLLWIVFSTPRIEAGTGFLGIGCRRLALGYLGAIAASAVFSVGETYHHALNQVDHGYLSKDAIWNVMPGWSVWAFGAFTTTSLIFMTVLGMPIFYLFSKIRLASFMGTLLVALILTAAWTFHEVNYDANQWCELHRRECAIRESIGFGIPALMAALGFSLGAGLPLLTSARRRPVEQPEDPDPGGND